MLTELVRRGHRVTVAVPAPFAATAGSTGATPLIYRSLLPDETRGQRWPDGLIEAVTLFFDEAQHVLPQLVEVFEHDRPDILLYDIAAHSARALAWRWGIPLVQLSPAMVAWDSYEQDMAETLALIRDDPAGQDYQRRFAAWLQAQGVSLSVDEFLGRPPRCIVLIPRVLQPHANRVDSAVYTFVEPCLDARPHQHDWPAPDRPLVLISLGSAYTDAPQFYRDCAAAFSGLGWQVVLAIGRHVDPAQLGKLPSGVEVHAWVPQLAVLRYASLFVTHAGMGGCSEGLFEGVPMIAVPQAVDPAQLARSRSALPDAGEGTAWCRRCGPCRRHHRRRSATTGLGDTARARSRPRRRPAVRRARQHHGLFIMEGPSRAAASRIRLPYPAGPVSNGGNTPLRPLTRLSSFRR